MCISSTPLRMTRAVEILEPQHRPSDAFDGPMVLLNNIVEVLHLTDLDGRFALGVHRVQRGKIGTAFVDGYRLGTPF